MCTVIYQHTSGVVDHVQMADVYFNQDKTEEAYILYGDL
jgi:hypothetical protein